MSDTEKKYDAAGEQPAEALDEAPEVDPFASLNRILDENPKFKKTFDALMRLTEDDTGPDELVDVGCLEIDGKEYLEIKRLEIAGTTYLLFANDRDVMDFMFQKVVVEDGEEYLVELDSEEEFELALACLQRDYLMELKERLKKGDEETPDGQPQAPESL